MSSSALTRLESLIPRLQAILIANGYSTNAGQHVVEGPVAEDETQTLPRLRLHWPSTDPESAIPNVPSNRVRENFVVEGEFSFTAATFYADADKIESDICKAVFGDTERNLQGLAIDVRFDGIQRTEPTAGTSVATVRVAGSFTHVRRFNNP